LCCDLSSWEVRDSPDELGPAGVELRPKTARAMRKFVCATRRWDASTSSIRIQGKLCMPHAYPDVI